MGGCRYIEGGRGSYDGGKECGRCWARMRSASEDQLRDGGVTGFDGIGARLRAGATGDAVGCRCMCASLGSLQLGRGCSTRFKLVRGGPGGRVGRPGPAASSPRRPGVRQRRHRTTPPKADSRTSTAGTKNKKWGRKQSGLKRPGLGLKWAEGVRRGGRGVRETQGVPRKIRIQAVSVANRPRGRDHLR